MKIKFFIILTMMISSILSQELPGIDKGNFRFKIIKSIDENKIEGNPFIFKNINTEVYGKNNNLLGNYILSYDGYNDNFIIKIKDQIGVFPKDNDIINHFKVGNSKYQQINFYHKGERYSSLMLVNYEGKKINLYKKHNVILDTGKKGNGIVSSRKSSYKRKKDNFFYLKKGTTSAYEVPKKSSEFLNIFGENKKQVSNYMKSNKLKNRKIEDLIKIFNFYDNL